MRQPGKVASRPFVIACLCFTVCCMLTVPSSAYAQGGAGVGGGAGGQGGGLGGGGGGGGLGGGGFGGQGGGAGGISVDAEGFVTRRATRVTSSKLAKKRMLAAAGKLPSDVNHPSKMRLVSLPALEAECKKLVENGQPLPPHVHYLAGLYRIDHVFLYPETGDIVLAGPAGGFATDGTGRMVNVDTGHPTLVLDDLLVALRSDGNLGCSIDPVPERLAQMLQYANSNNNAVTIPVAHQRYRQMSKIMGRQTVRTWGIPENSHFARALVDADYQMKLIAIGAEKSGVRGVISHLAMVRPGSNSIQRWWFAPHYESIQRTDDNTAWSLKGQRVHVLSQEEVSDADGNRSSAATTRESTQKFAKNFTKYFSKLAEKTPVFAELQNLFDVTMVAAIIRKADMLNQANWPMEFFGDAEKSPTAEFYVPTQTQSISNTKTVGKRLVIGLVSGGVSISAPKHLDSPIVKIAEDPGSLRKTVQRQQAGSWWWDAPATDQAAKGKKASTN